MTKTEIQLAEEVACGEDYCFVCRRPTDHAGEHTDQQFVEWANRHGIMQDIFWAKVDEL